MSEADRSVGGRNHILAVLYPAPVREALTAGERRRLYRQSLLVAIVAAGETIGLLLALATLSVALGFAVQGAIPPVVATLAEGLFPFVSEPQALLGLFGAGGMSLLGIAALGRILAYRARRSLMVDIAVRVTETDFRRVLGAEMAWHWAHHSGQVLHTIQSRAQTITRGILDPWMTGCEMLGRVVSVGMIVLAAQPALGLLALGVLVPPLLLLAALLGRRLALLGRASADAGQAQRRAGQEAFVALPEVRLLNLAPALSARQAALARRVWDIVHRMELTAEIPRTLVHAAVPIILVACVLTLTFTGSGLASVSSSLVAMLGLAVLRLLPALYQLFSQATRIRHGLALLNRLPALPDIATPQSALLSAPAHALSLKAAPSLGFDDVSFRYAPQDPPILRAARFDLPAGHCLAIEGASGMGKSTALLLLAGLLRPDAGHVRLDGKRMNGTRWPAVQAKIGLVTQHGAILDASLEENIALGLDGKPLDEPALQQALALARVDEILEHLPEGRRTHLGEHGARLSAGQRQRILLARALYRRPRILLLDEATNALNAELEAAILSGVRSRLEATLVLVSHRDEVARIADHRLRLFGGELRPVRSQPASTPGAREVVP